MASLKDIAANKTPTTSTSNKGQKPIGYINVKVLGANLFSRPVWAESTSDVELYAEINELALTDADALKALLTQLLVVDANVVEVEVSMNSAPPTTSIADLIAAMKK